MTLARIDETGSGKLECRMVIEGASAQFCTSAAMEQTLADGRVILNGLDIVSVRPQVRGDLIDGDISEGTFEVRILDLGAVFASGSSQGGRVTEELYKTPTLTTYLTQDLEVGATTANVSSTSGWPSSGRFHLGREVISYSGTNATQFTGLTRGEWFTVDQKHFTGDGSRIAYPRLTDRLERFEGRRVWFYFYGEGDDPLSSGTLRWRGVLSKGGSFRRGAWTFEVSNLAWLLSQKIGRDLEPVPISGIYYPAGASCTIELGECAGASLVRKNATQSDATVYVNGHFETEDAFCAELTTQLQAAIAGWGLPADTQLYAEPDPDSGWRLVYVAGTASPQYIRIERLEWNDQTVFSPQDHVLNSSHENGAVYWQSDVNGFSVSTVEGGQRYQIAVEASFPRSMFGTPLTSLFNDTDADAHIGASANPPFDVYVGGITAITSGMYAILPTPDDAEGESQWAPVFSFDAATRRIRFDFVGDGSIAFLDGSTELELARSLLGVSGASAQGSTIGVLQFNLVNESPSLANIGAMPLFFPGDFAPNWIPKVNTAIGDGVLGTDRIIIQTEALELREVLIPELRMLGLTLALDAVGRLDVEPLRLGIGTDEAAASIDESRMPGPFPQIDIGLGGSVRSVIFRQGYDWTEDEYRARPIEIVSATTGAETAGAIEVAPKSASAASRRGAAQPEITLEDAQRAASPVLGMFSTRYSEITTRVPLILWESIAMMSTVLITSPYLPAADGSLGLVAKPGIVTGWKWFPGEGGGEVTLLVHDLRLAGYVPSFPVASQVNDSGNRWTFTVTTADYTDRSAGAAAWFVADDLVELVQYDTASPTRQTGTVVSSTATTVTVDFASTFTPGADEWTLAYRQSAEVTSRQFQHVWIAEGNRQLTGPDGEVDGWVWAP